MGINTQNSRIAHHRLTTSGSIFTIPASLDFTDGSWLSTDLTLGELGFNMADDRAFFRSNNGIIELATASGLNRFWERDGEDIRLVENEQTSPVVYPNLLGVADSLCGLGTDLNKWKELHIGQSNNGIEIGNNGTNAGGSSSIAIGNNASASVAYSIAIGRNCTAANNNNNIAIGNGSNSWGSGDVAINGTTGITSSNSVAINGSVSAGNSIALAGGSTTGQFSISMLSVSSASGDHSIAIGNGSSASVSNSISLGQSSISTDGSIAIGKSSFSTGVNSVSIGYNSYTSTFDNGVAIGYQAGIFSDSAIAIGENSFAEEPNSIAIGDNTYSMKKNSVSIGSYSVAPNFSEYAFQGINSGTEPLRTGFGSSTRFGNIKYYGETSNATITELFLDGTNNSERFSVLGSSSNVYRLEITALGVKASNGDSVAYSGKGLIKDLSGTTSLVGTITMTQDFSDASLTTTSMTVVADNTNNSLKVSVTGVAATNIAWSVSVNYIKIEI
jgi:hypothetical protein